MIAYEKARCTVGSCWLCGTHILGCDELRFFNAKESVWTTVYWYLVYVTCPFWLLDMPSILTPILNSMLYGILAFLILCVSRKTKQD